MKKPISYPTPLKTMALSGRDSELIERFSAVSHRLDFQYFVQAGFKTDFSSIPPIYRMFLHPAGRSRRAAVIHDAMCRRKDVPRKLADKIYYDGCRNQGISALNAGVSYLGLRIFATWLRLKDLFR